MATLRGYIKEVCRWDFTSNSRIIQPFLKAWQQFNPQTHHLIVLLEALSRTFHGPGFLMQN